MGIARNNGERRAYGERPNNGERRPYGETPEQWGAPPVWGSSE